MKLYKLKIQCNADLANYGEDYEEIEWVEANSEEEAQATVYERDRLLKIREAKDNEYGAFFAGVRKGGADVERFNQAQGVAVEKRVADSWKSAVPMYLQRQRQQFLEALNKALAEIEEMKID